MTVRLRELREAREASESARVERSAAARVFWHRFRVACALALILAAYWLGYQCGFASALLS